MAHAEALAAEINDSEVLWITGMGHVLPEAVWDIFVPRVLQHISPASVSKKKGVLSTLGTITADLFTLGGHTKNKEAIAVPEKDAWVKKSKELASL